MIENKTINLANLLTLEKTVRDAADISELSFTLCNKTRSMLPFTQALLFVGTAGQMRLTGASDIAVIDKTSPLTTQMEKIVNRIEIHAETPLALPADEDELEALADLMPPFAIALPLHAAGRGLLGVLVLTHTAAFRDDDDMLLAHLAGSFGHALAVFSKPSLRDRLRESMRDKRKWTVLLSVLIVSLLPVSITAMAPASIRAAEPTIIAAPIDGVVDRIVTAPNSPVRRGDALVQLVDVELRNDFQVARRAFRVAEAELLRSRQLAFSNTEDKSRLSELQANLELRRAEMNFAEEQLGRSIIRATSDGIAVIGDVRQWQGRPVVTGEKIMEVAQSDRVEVEALLPVADAVTIMPGSRVSVFLDIRPMNAYDAEVVRVPYQSIMSETGILSYKVIARLSEDETPPRIGLNGTAKIYGPQSTLFYYVFRRPLTVLRQMVGW